MPVQPPVTLPFGEWLPDLPALDNPGCTVATNVVPKTVQSYGPMSGPSVYSTPITKRCQGSYTMEDNGGNVFIFAGDANSLYLLKAGSPSFTNVSAGMPSTPTPYSVPTVPDGFWSATAFGTRAIFTDYVDAIQTFNVASDTTFSVLSSAAPKAKFCCTIRDFLMVGNTSDSVNGAVPYRVWWSAIGDPTNWPTPGSLTAISVQSDFQDLVQTDLGHVTGMVGGLLSSADGAAFCERGIYSINYAGSPDIFSFAVAQGATGTRSPLSIVQRQVKYIGVASVAYYLGEDGFRSFDGSSTLPIGAEKVDTTFFNDLDPAYLTYVQGFTDPLRKLVFWAYMGQGNGGYFNKVMVYNWDLNRWAQLDLTLVSPAEWFTRSVTIGYDLEQLDAFGDLEQLQFSFDSPVWAGGAPLMAMFDNLHQFNYLTGSNLPVTIETGEKQFFPGRRGRVSNVRPITDGTPASVTHGHREQNSNIVTYEVAVPQNFIGECPQLSSGRYQRFRMTLPAATQFTHAQGMDVYVKPEAGLQ